MIKPGLKIFIADEIHQTGINYLKKKGYQIIKVTGLSNKDLIKFLSHFKSKKPAKKQSVLIIRTVRSLNFKELAQLAVKTDVKLLCAASSGYNNIDLASAKKLKFDVMNVPNATCIPAAEHTIALMLSIIKNIIPANSDMKSGIFNFSKFQNTELFDKTIGIIGVGRVGSHVAKIARAFGMKVIGNDIKSSLKNKYKWIQFTTVNRLLEFSDFITVHTPYDKTTKDLINRSNLRKVKKSAILINCARGGIINEAALLSALKAGRFFYAGLDVFSSEPGFERGFARLKNVILTPHLAGKTEESKERSSAQLARRIEAYFSSKKRTVTL